MENNLELFIKLAEVLAWPAIGLIALLCLRIPIKQLLQQFSTANNLKLSVGSLTIQAQAMREIHDSIGLGFQDDTVRKAQIEALIDSKIRSVQSAIEYEVSEAEIRSDIRKVTSQEIKITDKFGKTFDGETLDISEAGIGFKSNGLFQFHDFVQVEPIDSSSKTDDSFFNRLMVVRIEQADEGFYYGCKSSN